MGGWQNGGWDVFSFAANPPTGPYGSTTSVIVGPSQVNLQALGADMSGSVAADAIYTAALAQLPNGKGLVYAGPGTLKLNSSPAVAGGVELVGAGKDATTLNIFAPIAPAGTHWSIRRMKITANACHVFQPSASVDQSELLDLQVNGAAGAFSLWAGAAKGYIDMAVERCLLNAHASATVAAWSQVSTSAASPVNSNTWRRCRFHSNLNGQPFIYLENNFGSGSFNYDNVFEDITGEQNNGGIINIKGSQDTRLANIAVYDVVTFLADVFSLTNSTDGAPVTTRGLVAINCGRRGGALGGFSDFTVTGPANPQPQVCVLIGCNPSSGNPTYTITGNVSVLDSRAIIGWAGSLAGAGTYASGAIAAGAQIYPGLPAAGGQTASGLLAGTGAPNNANGNNGDIYFRSDGGAGTTIYQKRAGAWVATAA